MTEPNKLFGRLGNRMFQMAYIYAQLLDGTLPDLYLQDPKYFEKHEKEIKSFFGEGIGYLPYTAIHVRRGDYVDNPFHVDLGKTDYYEQAIAYFPYDNFLVFSDDPKWCQEKWGQDGHFKIMDRGDEIEDFNLMSSCKNHIIANSSFSWWSAYLSPNLGKTIIAPSVKNWHTDGMERTVCPSNWIRI